jgi:putative phosphoesterase
MERIGLLSDSHGRAEPTSEGVNRLVEQGAQGLLHLGDVGSEAVLEALVVAAGDGAGTLPVWVVFGNTDGRAGGLTRHAQRLGLGVAHPLGWLDLADGQQLAFCHGHERQRMRQALKQTPAYLCHGHTHVASDQYEGSTRVINPGALHRARQYTVALLEPAARQVRFLTVGRA